MQTTTALRLYGKRDLRPETLPSRRCRTMRSSPGWSLTACAFLHGKRPIRVPIIKKVPDDVATRPIIIGHEFCGEILAVGKSGSISFSQGSAT